MPIYMDVHMVPGVKARDVAEAHSKDVFVQDAHACRCMTYWIDEERESIFCLIEAPDKESVIAMHNQAHGLIPNKIIEVQPSVVESFLGRIYDPDEATTTDDGLKVFSDPSFRVLVLTTITDPVLLQHQFGKEKTQMLLQHHREVVRRNLRFFDGREVEHGGTGFIISFTSAARAVSFALTVQKEMNTEEARELNFRISIHGGEPIEKTNRLFGDVIQMAQYMSAATHCLQVAITSVVKDLVTNENLDSESFFSLPPQDELLLMKLYATLEVNWQNAEFDVDDFCREMAMSKSQLYRKTICLTGLSPNVLLKEFRLEKARELMRKKYHNIAQVTFDSGFTSPSYFTKCFKKKFGLLPANYMEMAS